MIIENLNFEVLLWVGWFVVLPLLFIIVWARDMINLKLKSVLLKRKGGKLIVDVTKDKNVSFGIETLTNDKKLKRDKDYIEWNPIRQFFSPQFGIQTAFVFPGTKAISDPIADTKLDLADGEVVDRMVKRAELMRDMDAGWFDSKEQKLMIIVLIVCLITAGISFATSSQIGEAMAWLRPAVSGIQQSITAIPRPL